MRLLNRIAGTAEAATILGVARNHVCALCADGRIPARRLYCGWIMLVEDVRAYQAKTHPPGDLVMGRPKKGRRTRGKKRGGYRKRKPA